MSYNQISDLVNQSINLTNKIMKLQVELDFYDNLFMQSKCHEHSSYCDCAYANFRKAEEIQMLINIYQAKKQDICVMYDRLKNKTYSNGIYYAITIGSAEKNSTEPCFTLWNRFIHSADAKDFVTKEAYFEKGENGYIHIHALVQKSKGWSMSTNKMRIRYGKYKQKQHNFDIKRLKGLEITKWSGYIKKDRELPWNKIVNPTLI